MSAEMDIAIVAKMNILVHPIAMSLLAMSAETEYVKEMNTVREIAEAAKTITKNRIMMKTISNRLPVFSEVSANSSNDCSDSKDKR